MQIELKNMEARLHREGVKFTQEGNSFKWKKTLRSANCAICEKRVEEKIIDEGFPGWGLLIHEIDADGNAPEICPDCMKGFNNNIISPCRILKCRCGVSQKEKIYGVGFPGWKTILPLGEQSTNSLCPNCIIELAIKLGPSYVRGTWVSLTYALNSLLTSAKMTQNQANFAALADGDAGCPAGERMVKGWIQFNGTGGIAIQDSFNVSSIVDDGVGRYSVNWDTDFANDDFSVVANCGNEGEMVRLESFATGSSSIRAYTHAGATVDVSYATLIAIGDQ